jgi:hypothetical protein
MGRLQHILDVAICEGAATAIRSQEGSTESWLAASNINGSHCALALVCNAGWIVVGVVRLLAADSARAGEQHWRKPPFKLDGYIVGDEGPATLRIDKAFRHEVFDGR